MKEILFKVARSNASSHFIGYAFEKMSSLMPLDRVVDTPKTVVFRHPVSQWQHHLLAVPKKSIRDFTSLDLNNPTYVGYLKDLLKATQQAASEQKLKSFVILLNGGEYQDVPQFHLHLISGKSKDNIEPIYAQYHRAARGKLVEKDRDFVVLESDSPFREFHTVIHSQEPLGTIQTINLDDNQVFSTVIGILQKAQEVVNKSKLDRYTLLSVHQPESYKSEFIFHLVSGKSTEQD